VAVVVDIAVLSIYWHEMSTFDNVALLFMMLFTIVEFIIRGRCSHGRPAQSCSVHDNQRLAGKREALEIRAVRVEGNGCDGCMF
jgi:hypothetical protein